LVHPESGRCEPKRASTFEDQRNYNDFGLPMIHRSLSRVLALRLL